MDDAVIQRLSAAGFDVTLQKQLPIIAVAVDKQHNPLPLGLDDEVPVLVEDKKAVGVIVKRTGELFTGNVVPPSFSRGPTPAYERFFMLLERTAVDYCGCIERKERDQEVVRVYSALCRRPDGRDQNPIFSYLQAAARIYMSLKPVSRAEYEAVFDRLRTSAKRFAQGPASTNYIDAVRNHV